MNSGRKNGSIRTEGCVMISSSLAKQLRTERATDWNMSRGQPSGLSLLLNIRAKNEYPIPCNKRNHKSEVARGFPKKPPWSCSQCIISLRSFMRVTFIRCNRACLSQSRPLTNFGTKNKVANFSVSVSAASRARRHFFTGSERG